MAARAGADRFRCSADVLHALVVRTVCVSVVRALFAVRVYVPLFGKDRDINLAANGSGPGAANAAQKLTSVIAGMAVGAGSVDDAEVVRAGGV